MQSKLSNETQRLLETSVESFEKLDILLFLWRRRGSWSPRQVADELQLTEGEVARLFDELTRAGLTSAPQEGHYIIAQTANGAVGELARSFDETPIEVVRCLSARAMHRIRKTTEGAFAEALSRRRSRRP